MEITQFQVQARDEFGKGPARRLRMTGVVPGVAYGLGRETVHLAVTETELNEMLRASDGNVVLDLDVPGVDKQDDVAAIVKDIQRDPITRAALNVDFQWISLAEKITVDVAVTVIGEAPGVVDDGGVVQQQYHQVLVSCLPMDIPESVLISIDGMAIGDALYARDLQVPEGAELMLDEDEAVLSIAAPISDEDLETRIDEGLLDELVDLEGEEELEEGDEEAVEGEEAPEEEAPAADDAASDEE